MNFQNWMIVAAMISLTACLDTKDAPEPTPVGYINLYNAAPNDGSSLDIYLNDNKVNTTAFDYSKYSGYLNFPAGSNTLKFNQYNASTKLLESTFNVDADKPYTFFIINEGTQLSTLILKDSSGVATAGKARLRFIHLSPNPSLLVDLNLKVADTPDSTFFEGKSYKSASEFIEVPSKIYSLDLINKADGSVLTTLADVNLESAKYYTIIAKGFDPGKIPTGNNNKITLQLLKN